MTHAAAGANRESVQVPELIKLLLAASHGTPRVKSSEDSLSWHLPQSRMLHDVHHMACPLSTWQHTMSTTIPGSFDSHTHHAPCLPFASICERAKGSSIRFGCDLDFGFPFDLAVGRA
eukprot:scaffold133_cov257-Pinguiococcus_pyrenoidosus.AAC.29